MATLKDVAQRAGVTTTTVSRVINNRGAISEKTRHKVLHVMQDMGYQPNEAARLLSGKSSNFIGVIVPSVAIPFFAEVVSALEYNASRQGYKIILCNSNHQREKELEYMDMLKSNKVAGIVLASRTRSFKKNISDGHLPIVSFERVVSDELSAVVCNNYQGGVLATQHLVDCGCKNLIHIGGVINLSMPADARCRGFLDVCEKENVKHRVVSTLEKHFQNMNYTEIVENILDDDPTVDGIFTSSDIIAAEVVHVCRQRSIGIPEQLMVVGFDDICLAQLISPRLTTIHQPVGQMCQLAVESIISQHSGKGLPCRIELNVRLVQRETTRMKP